MRCVALDLGLRELALTQVANGNVVKCVKMKPSMLHQELGPDTPPARVAIEAGRQSLHYYRLLTGWGHKVSVVDTTRVRRIGVGQHGKKNDKADSTALAFALERDDLPLAHVLSVARHQLREMLNERQALVQCRTMLVNSMRGELAAHGVLLRKVKPVAFDEAVTRESEQIGPTLIQRLASRLAVLRELNKQIGNLDEALCEVTRKDPMMSRLMTVPGVGVLTVCWLVSVVDNAERFPNGHALAAYLGLAPAEATTGGNTRIGHITRQGHSDTRSCLIQAAWTVLRSKNGSDPLHIWSHQVAARRGKPIAVVALARKLVGVLWALWVKGTAYEPQRLGLAMEEGLRKEAVNARQRADATLVANRKRQAHLQGQRRNKVTPTSQPSSAQPEVR